MGKTVLDVFIHLLQCFLGFSDCCVCYKCTKLSGNSSRMLIKVLFIICWKGQRWFSSRQLVDEIFAQFSSGKYDTRGRLCASFERVTSIYRNSHSMWRPCSHAASTYISKCDTINTFWSLSTASNIMQAFVSSWPGWFCHVDQIFQDSCLNREKLRSRN